tara:strand:+ start:2635 stop:2832 length:198 start_codon:yes stop_codon:yes gene_type:complete
MNNREKKIDKLSRSFNHQISHNRKSWRLEQECRPSPEKVKRCKVRRRIEELKEQMTLDKEYEVAA